MFGLIFSGVFLFFALLFMLVGALRGKKTAWQLSVTRTVLSFVAAILAALLASLIAWFGVGMLLDVVVGLVRGSVDVDIDAILADVPAGKDALTALVAMIVAPLLYLILYAILRPILKAFTKLIARPFMKLTTKGAEKDKADVKKVKKDTLEEVAFSDVENKYAADFVEKDAEPNAEEGGEDIVAKYEAENNEDVVSKYMSDIGGISADEPTKEEAKELRRGEFKLAKNSWIGALCGAICSLVTMCMLAIPMVGFLDVVDDVVGVVASADEIGSGMEQTLGMVGDIVDGAANNAGTTTVKVFGGGLIYDIMTTYTVDGVRTTLRDETRFISTTASAAMTVMDDSGDKETRVESIKDVKYAFNDADLIPILVADLTSAASESWKNGESFHGLNMPSMGAAIDPMMMSVVEAFSTSGRETIKEDFATIVDIFVTLEEKDALKNTEENPLSMLSDEETTARLLLSLLENPRLGVLVDGVSDFGVGIMLSAVDAEEEIEDNYDELCTELLWLGGVDEADLTVKYRELFDKYGLDVSAEKCSELAMNKLSGGNVTEWVAQNVVSSKEDYLAKTSLVSIEMVTEGRNEVTNKENEADILADAYAKAYALMDKMSHSSFGIDDMVSEMGPVLDAFAKSETMGEQKTAYMLKAMLQSEMVHDEIGFTVMDAAESADSISKNAKTKSYATMLNSLMLAVDVVEAASDVNLNTADAVEKMLDDLTPESAEVLNTISTPDVMKNYGVPDRSAAPTSELMGDTFSNLADKKPDMSEEEYAKESAAVSNMMSVIMTSGSGPIFGERSATGITSDEFVSDIMESQVMSDTLIEKVYTDGSTPVNDPLNSERTMSQEEKDSFITSLNNEWEKSDKSEKSEQKIVSIASIMNVEIEITAGGIIEK